MPWNLGKNYMNGLQLFAQYRKDDPFFLTNLKFLNIQTLNPLVQYMDKNKT